MKKITFILCLAALGAFTAQPLLAQHGGSKHGGSSSMHGNTADGKGSNNSSSAIAEKLTDNTKLAGKLQSLLPAGTDLGLASQGFKNLGQFVAAVHVAHNLGIPFDVLKAKMMGPPKESLGQAVHALKPTANSKSEASKANKQAKQDIADSKSS